MIMLELKKIMTAPMIRVLTIGVLTVSGAIALSQIHIRDELALLTGMVARYGHEITDETLVKWEREHHLHLADMNTLIKPLTGETFESAQAFNDVLRQGGIVLTEEAWHQVRKTTVMENYLLRALGADYHYRTIDLMDYGEGTIATFELSHRLADTIRHHFSKAQLRFESLIENHEHVHFFFNGHHHEMHTFLFRRVLGSATFGSLLIGVLLTSFILGYEFDQQTAQVTYATKIGRNLQQKKVKAALIGITLITTLILSSVLLLYFTLYDHSGLWNVPISSVFVSEPLRFFVSVYSFTFWQYIMAVIAVIYITQWLMVLLTSGIWYVVRSSYLSFILVIIIFVIGINVSNLFPRHSNLVFYAGFNPFFMIFDLSTTFMVGAISDAYRHFELVTITIWLVLLTLITTKCHQKFKQSER